MQNQHLLQCQNRKIKFFDVLKYSPFKRKKNEELSPSFFYVKPH